MRKIDPDELDPVRGGFVYVNGSGTGVLVSNVISLGAGIYGLIKGVGWTQDFLHRNDTRAKKAE